MKESPTNVEMYEFIARDKARRRRVIDRLGKCCERQSSGGFCRYLLATCPYIDEAFRILQKTRGIK